MSVLQVSNIHFESTGNNRLQYTGSNGYILVGGGSNVATINTTAVDFPLDLVANNVAFSNISFEATGNNRIEYAGSNTWQFVAGGANVFTVNTTSAIFPDSISVTGAATLSNTIAVTGAATFSNTVSVTDTITATDFNSLSDIELKQNVKPVDNSAEILSKINPVTFEWKQNGKKSYGMIAQEIEKVLPELVLQQENGYKSVAYIQLIALLIDAVNNLNKEVETLKTNKS